MESPVYPRAAIMYPGGRQYTPTVEGSGRHPTARIQVKGDNSLVAKNAPRAEWGAEHAVYPANSKLRAKSQHASHDTPSRGKRQTTSLIQRAPITMGET